MDDPGADDPEVADPGADRPAAPLAPAAHLASDAEREACVAVLRTACGEGRLTVAEFTERMHAAYGSRTDLQLAELVRDLPHGGQAGRFAPPAPSLPSPVTGRPGTAASVGIMSGCERRGAWTVARSHTAVAVMGGVELDLRAASLESAETTILAVAVMGAVEIIVPQDWDVRVMGFAVMGAHEDKVRRGPLAPGAPVVTVRGYAVMGGVAVVTRRPEGGAHRELPPHWRRGADD